MDLRMPRMDGIEAIRRLAARGERPRAIALTTYADDASVLGALRAGARGYLTKDAGAEQIRAAIARVARGEAASTRRSSTTSSRRSARPPSRPRPEPPDDLTPREAEVLELIAEGLSNTEIAERLVVSRGDREEPRQPHLRQDRRPRPRAGGRLRLRQRHHGFVVDRVKVSVFE